MIGVKKWISRPELLTPDFRKFVKSTFWFTQTHSETYLFPTPSGMSPVLLGTVLDLMTKKFLLDSVSTSDVIIQRDKFLTEARQSLPVQFQRGEWDSKSVSLGLQPMFGFLRDYKEKSDWVHAWPTWIRSIVGYWRSWSGIVPMANGTKVKSKIGIVGIPDLVTPEKVIELKAVSKFTDPDFLQLLVYMYLLKREHGELINLKTGEVYEIKSNFNDLEALIARMRVLDLEIVD